MRHLTRFLFLTCLALLCVTQGSKAQQYEYLDVTPGFETLNLAIERDTLATGLAKSMNRVYRLQRGGTYLMNGMIVNIHKAPLRIFAADGTGAKPLIIIAATTTGASYDFASIEGDAYFKNIYISGIDNLGNQCRYTMAVQDSGAKLILDGVHIDHSRQSAIRSYGMNQKIFFYNCEFRNGIDLAAPSNGRFYDGRGLMVDSIVWQNCTVYLNSQRMFRVDGAIVKNLIFDHNTFYLNAYGSSVTSGTGNKMTGGIETAKGVFVRITNNIFKDINVEAIRHAKTITPLDRVPVIPVDSLGSTTISESSRNWVVKNNAYCWSPGFKTFWATIDSVDAPMFIGPYGDSAFFAKTPSKFVKSNNFEELIQFTDAPSSDSLLKYVQHRYKTNFTNIGNPDPRADRNGIASLTSNPNSFGLETTPFKFDYPTTLKAYTAGDGGYPLGDLNWFPTKKTQWAANPTAVEQNVIVTDYALEQNYPNPFNPTTQINFTLPKATRMSIVIYNALGQEVATLMDNQEQSAGKHSMNWGGKDAHGNSISTGVYFYQLRTSDTQITKKMVLVK